MGNRMASPEASGVPRMTAHNCPPREDGLSHCCVCGGAEVSLTRHCPERKLTEGEEIAVMAGALDFIDGKWINPVRHTNVEGFMPVNVNTIDTMDTAVTTLQRQVIEGNRLLYELKVKISNNAPALRYAKARIKLEDPDYVTFLTLEEKAAAKIELKRARKNYFDQIERDESY